MKNQIKYVYDANLGITAVDHGGTYIDLFNAQPADFLEGEYVEAFDTVNSWDYAANRRRKGFNLDRSVSNLIGVKFNRTAVVTVK